MEKTLERVKKAVSGYRPKQKDNELRTSRSLLQALSECKKYINENSGTDRGCAQRLAREISELLGELPTFQNILADKKLVHNLHTRQLAEEHLSLLQKHLEDIVKEEEKGKIRLIHDWVKQHSVFDELKRAVRKTLPKNAYVLLFSQRNDDDELQLVTRKAADGRVFTRFRTQEFGDDLKVHKSFNRQPAIVGAAVVAAKELLALAGKVPPAKENSDQLRTLLSISSQKASEPAKQFVEMNAVLKELNKLSHGRSIPKDAYILLFQASEVVADAVDEAQAGGEPVSNDESATIDETQAEGESAAIDETQASDESVTNDETQAEGESAAIDETQASDESVTNDETQASDESAIDNEVSTDILNVGATPCVAHIDSESQVSNEDGSATDETQAGDGPATADETQASDESVSTDESLTDDQSATSNEPAIIDFTLHHAPVDPTLVVKKNKEGKVVTRFWGVDFAVSHRLFDAFRGKPAIVGAAIIKNNKIKNVFGVVPKPAEGQTQLDALLHVSKSSVEKPFIDFLEENEVLKGLHGLANSNEARMKDAHVIFFGETDGAKLIVVNPRPGNSRAPILLNEFQSAKIVHDRFVSKPKLAGASVIGVSKAHVNRAPQFNKGPSDSTKRRSQAPADKPVVLAAFGRTPLKANLLATPEILQRLGIDIRLF